jgi:mRNA interferase RelE/StbE
MKYRIFETEGFIEDLGQDFGGRQQKILKKLRSYVYPQLKENPWFGPNIKRLRDFSHDTWRCRIGDYRFFYQIDEKEKIVFMIAAEHRKQSYR